MKSWKTTLCGAVAAAAQGIKSLIPVEWAWACDVVALTATGLLGFFAKDSGVTGTDK